MSTRKKWKTQAMGGGPVDEFPSQTQAYDFVIALRSAWQAGANGTASIIDVMVDEGSGWQLYERINFAAEV